MKYSLIDLFCGAGGLSCGFEKAGFDVLLGIDNDQQSLKTFELNHKNAKTICGDITKISKDDIKRILGDRKIDIIIGGPPCQGMSLSGPRKFDDPRNKLYLSYIRLVKEIKPLAFVIENVPGLVTLFKGAIKDNILKEFADIGYMVDYKVLCSSEYGVPQNRKRVIFVGHKKGVFKYPSKNRSQVSCAEALSDLPPLIDNIGNEKQEYILEPQNKYQKFMRKDSFAIFNHVAANHSENVKNTIALIPPGGNYKNLPNGFKSSRNFHVAWTRFPENKPAPTIDTGHRHHFHYKYNRVPTVRECARIQSFPDRFVFTGNKTQQFRQVGNAVPPIMAQCIAVEIKKMLIKGNND